MPVPKRKRSRARRDSRHANKFIKTKTFKECSNCQEAIVPHVACVNCGFYKGEKVMKTKLDRSVSRVEARVKKSPKKADEENTNLDTQSE